MFADKRDVKLFAGTLQLHLVSMNRCVNGTECQHNPSNSLGAIADNDDDGNEPLQCSLPCGLIAVQRQQEHDYDEPYYAEPEVVDQGTTHQIARVGKLEFNSSDPHVGVLQQFPLVHSTLNNWGQQFKGDLKGVHDSELRNAQLDLSYLKFLLRSDYTCPVHDDSLVCTAAACTMRHFFEVVKQLLSVVTEYTTKCLEYKSEQDFERDENGLYVLVQYMVALEDQAMSLGLFIWYSMRADARESNPKLSELLCREAESYPVAMNRTVEEIRGIVDQLTFKSLVANVTVNTVCESMVNIHAVMHVLS
jgi:hypothetical protein